MKKAELKKLQYAAPYDHAAALMLANEYISGAHVARDKYLAFTYYKMFCELSKHNPKPLTVEEAQTLKTIQNRVEAQLKTALYLDGDMQPTRKTTIRGILSTGAYRETTSWISLIRATILRANGFLNKLNLAVLGNIFGKIPILSSLIAAGEITFELGIVAKNGMKKAWTDFRGGNGFHPFDIAHDVNLSLKKDGRRSRIFISAVWLTIGVASLCVAAVAAPLLVAGSLIDLVYSACIGLRDMYRLYRERKFIKNELDECQKSLANVKDSGTDYPQVASMLNGGEVASNEAKLSSKEIKYLQTKETRLKFRETQIRSVMNYETSKIASNVVMSSIIVLGAALTLVPGAQLAGLSLIALGGAGFFGLKLIEKCFNFDHRTQLAITKEEVMPEVVNSPVGTQPTPDVTVTPTEPVIKQQQAPHVSNLSFLAPNTRSAPLQENVVKSNNPIVTPSQSTIVSQFGA